MITQLQFGQTSQGVNFLGSVSDVEFGKDESHLFVTLHNYGVENIFLL
ncbi:MAG: hypothetical protein ACJ0O9_03475 [Flavobacteriaceae bacterium]